ncbi:MAG: 23S rRNA (uracil(1939)-C(5))-methyltransferase RlmD [Anaerococcus sp.]|nr:23S rRNA (uracil(1939)-C(5))-methyltransferase RlmD [Anaerococcus sp.]
MVIEDIKIIDILQDGRGVGRKDGKVYFVEGAVLGEICTIEIIEEKKNFTNAKKVKTTQTSDHYRKPPCPYYYECGGCSIMDIDYKSQIQVKKNLIKNALRKTAGISIEDLEMVESKEFAYRNKIRLQVGKNGKLAYKKKYSDDLVYIEDCMLANEHIRSNFKKILSLSQDISKALGDLIDQISIRSNGKEILLNIYTTKAKEIFTYLRKNYKAISFRINLIDKREVLSIGLDYLEFNLMDKVFKVSRDDFYQVNDFQIENLYKLAKSFIKKDQKLLDLFCGSGISSIAINGDRIVGIEINKSAIEDAKENARRNGLKDYKFISKNAKYIGQKFIEKEKIGSITLDPPRAGLDKEIIKAIGKSKVDQIVYISCNPQTLARDIKRFMNLGYELSKIKPVDMFPQTMHVEALTLLTRKL